MTTDAFWSSRPVLQHVLTLARARGVGPWAVLGSTLARATATVPSDISLPGIVGGRMSLNLCIALVGPSGGGKGAAMATAADGFNFGDIEIVPLGTGEGIARTFCPIGTKPGEPNPLTTAIFDAPEIDTFAAIATRQGSTLSAELRKVYSGEQLGFGNAGKDTRNVVPAGSYRACLTVGVQPLRSHTLLGAADGGLPQRFAWMPTSDPDAPDEPSTDPGVWNVQQPSWLRAVGSRVDLIVPEVATDAIRAHRLAVLREEPGVDPLDGHALLTRLKVAAALMALDGRTIIDNTDWRLAGHIMDVSNYTRERCRRALDDAHRRTLTARALDAAERDEIISERKLQRAKQAVLRRLDRHGGAPIQQREIRRGLKSDIRDYFDPATDELAAEGLISAGHDGKAPIYMRSTWTTGSTPPDQRKHHVDPYVHVDHKRPHRRRRERNRQRATQQTGEQTA